MNEQTIYLQHLRLLHKLVHRHCERHNCNRDEREEAALEANLLFMQALRTWKRQRGKLTTHLYHVVRGGLLDAMKRRLHKKRQEERYVSEVGRRKRNDFDFDRWIAELSGDAAELAGMAVEQGITLRCASVAGGIGVGPRYGADDNLREASCDVLRARGWSGRRILAAFVEIGGNLP